MKEQGVFVFVLCAGKRNLLFLDQKLEAFQKTVPNGEFDGQEGPASVVGESPGEIGRRGSSGQQPEQGQVAVEDGDMDGRGAVLIRLVDAFAGIEQPFDFFEITQRAGAQKRISSYEAHSLFSLIIRKNLHIN